MPPRPTLNPTVAFYAAVAEYQATRGLKSWSQAVLELAAIGYQAEMGQMPPAPYAPWGGSRQPDQLDLERLEVKLLGLPPLADDDPDD